MKKMSKMTIHLGLIVFVVCLSAQVVSQSSPNTTVTNSTSNSNTTMAPGTYSSSANSTKPTGAGILLHADIYSFLIPIIMAASHLQCYC